MAESSKTQQLASIVKELQTQRQKHLDAIAVIDETFAAFGIAPEGQENGRRKKKRGRPKGSKKKTVKKKTAKKKTGKKTTAKKKSAKNTGSKARGKKRPRYAKTAEEFVLGLLGGGKKLSTAEINSNWKQAGRAGSANTTLTKLKNQKAVKAETVKGTQGSQYRAA